MSETLHCSFHENFFESGENLGAGVRMCYEESATYHPAISFVEFSLVDGVFEPLLVAVQDLDVEFVSCSEVVQDSGDDHFVIVFADSETVFAVAEISIYPAKMCGVERVNCYSFLDEIEFIATDDVRLGASALVSRGPIGCAILFDFLEELVGPEVFQLYLDIFSVFAESIDLSLHLDGGDGCLGAIDDEIDGDLEERIDEGETFLCGATFGAVFVEVVAGGY